jgi:protein-S-isoprenylcysteine O-methyltransferase
MSALTVSLWAWFALEAWVLGRDRRRVSGRRADRGSLFLLAVMIPLGIWGAVTAALRVPGAEIAAPQPGLMDLGVVMMWAGMALRLWSVLTLGPLFRVTVVLQDDHQLVTRGPYSRLRHPSYTGAILTMTGLGVGCGNWVSLGVIATAALIGFGWRVRAEEAALRGRFGEAYDAYARRTWAVAPFIW